MSSCTSQRAACKSDLFDYERTGHLVQNVRMHRTNRVRSLLSTVHYLECGGLPSEVRHTKEGGQTPLWLLEAIARHSGIRATT